MHDPAKLNMFANALDAVEGRVVALGWGKE